MLMAPWLPLVTRVACCLCQGLHIAYTLVTSIGEIPAYEDEPGWIEE